MKKYYATIQIIIMFLLSGFISAAQQKKMPITSSSSNAVELYYEATAAMENAELARGETLLNVALKRDPEFFMGLFQLALNNLFSGNIDKFKKCAESAFISNCAYSEGEKILQEVLKRLYKNPKADVTDLGRELLQLYPEDKLVHYTLQTFHTIKEDYAGIPDIKGAWELVYAKSVAGDKIINDFPENKAGNQIKIWSENHFASVGKYQSGNQEKDYYSAGTYTLNKNRYQETIFFHKNKIWVGARPQKYFEIKGDTLFQTWPVNVRGDIDKNYYSVEKYVRANTDAYPPSAEIRNETFLYFEAMKLQRQAEENIKTKVGENIEMSVLAETHYPAQFRGTNCSGVAPAAANPPVYLLPDENLAWKTEIASGVSSPCLWSNSVFLTGYDPYDRLLITYCIEKETGAVKWNQSVMPDAFEPVHAVGSPASATPVTDGKHVYVYFGSYGIVCYDFEGKLVWEKRLPVLKTRYGSCASPVILKDKLILNRFEVDNPVVLAIEPSTGETIWKTKLSGISGLTEALQRSQSTPVLWNDQVILHRSLALCSVNIDNGKENWSIPLVSMGTSTPVIFDDVLYVNGYSNLGEARLYDKLPDFSSMLTKYDGNKDSLIQFQEIPESLAFFRRPQLDLPLKYDTLFSWNLMAPSYDISQDKALNEQEWKGMEQFWSKFYEEHGVVAIDLKNAGKTNSSEYLWKENEFIAEVPSLLYAGSQIYMISNGGLVTCMNIKTGEVIYREKLSAPGAYLASPLLANGHIYFASYNGKITVVKPGDTLNVVSQCNLKEKIAASPLATEDKLIIRTDKVLYAFEN